MSHGMVNLRDDSGFTLTELLVAMTVGIVVLFGVFGLLETTVKLSARTTDRVESTAAARQAMDLVTRQIRSQVCLSGDPSTPKPALLDATPNSMTFYASLAPESPTLTIQRRKVEYIPGAAGAPGTITETVETGTGTRPNVTFPTAPTTKVIAENVVREKTSAGVDVPIFKYFKLEDNTTSPNYSEPVLLPSTSLTLAERQRTAQVEVSFAIKRRKSDTRVALSNRVYVRTSNPTKPELSPVCL